MNTKTIIGLSLIFALFFGISGNVSAQSTTASTTTVTNLQAQYIFAQTQAVLLLGQQITSVTAQSASHPELASVMREVQLLWINLAQEQISRVRLAFGV